MFKGLDLSYAQTTTPPLVGFDFIIVKASQEDFVDPMWTTHSAAVRKAGLALAAYHYLKPASVKSIATQAGRFLSTARTAEYLFVDQEGAVTDAETQQFLDIVRSHRECGLYHSSCGFGGISGDDAQWVADYRDPALAFPRKCNTADGEFPGWDIWQYTSEGKVAGYTGDLDLNYMNPKSPLVGRLRVGYRDPAPLQATIDAQAALLAQCKTDAAAAKLLLDQAMAANDTLTARTIDLQTELDKAPEIERNRIAEAEASRIRGL